MRNIRKTKVQVARVAWKCTQPNRDVCAGIEPGEKYISYQAYGETQRQCLPCAVTLGYDSRAGEAQ